MAELLRGAPVVAAITEELQARVERLAAHGVTPGLTIVRVGEREDDISYERSICSRAAKVGVAVTVQALDASCTDADLPAVIAQANADASVHGILLFRPLPSTLDEARACAALDPAKDVDCLTPQSLFGVFARQPVGYPPCTAQAIIEMLDHVDVPLSGANVVVVGRSLVVGRPVSMMLQAKDATVTMCHTKTRDLAHVCSQADVLVVAAGCPGLIGADAVRSGQVVIDAGVNWDARAGRLVGDCRFDEVEPIVRAVTPVPGGLGAVTTAVLCKHVVNAAEVAAGEECAHGGR